MAMHQEANLALMATTSKQKSLLMLLALSMKRFCLHLIALSRMSTAVYFTIGVNTRLFQVLKQDA